MVGFLEAVMNLFRNSLRMRKTSFGRESRQSRNPHSNEVPIRVHNTLYKMKVAEEDEAIAKLEEEQRRDV